MPQPLVPLLLLGPPFFSDYSFWIHHLVNWDDRHLLAHAMASDFSFAWQCLSKRTVKNCNCYGMDSMTVNTAAPVTSLEASLVLVA
jgi:hypothetical protein